MLLNTSSDCDLYNCARLNLVYFLLLLQSSSPEWESCGEGTGESSSRSLFDVLFSLVALLLLDNLCRNPCSLLYSGGRLALRSSAAIPPKSMLDSDLGARRCTLCSSSVDSFGIFLYLTLIFGVHSLDDVPYN